MGASNFNTVSQGIKTFNDHHKEIEDQLKNIKNQIEMLNSLNMAQLQAKEEEKYKDDFLANKLHDDFNETLEEAIANSPSSLTIALDKLYNKNSLEFDESFQKTYEQCYSRCNQIAETFEQVLKSEVNKIEDHEAVYVNSIKANVQAVINQLNFLKIHFLVKIEEEYLKPWFKINILKQCEAYKTHILSKKPLTQDHQNKLEQIELLIAAVHNNRIEEVLGKINPVIVNESQSNSNPSQELSANFSATIKKHPSFFARLKVTRADEFLKEIHEIVKKYETQRSGSKKQLEAENQFKTNILEKAKEYKSYIESKQSKQSKQKDQQLSTENQDKIKLLEILIDDVNSNRIEKVLATINPSASQKNTSNLKVSAEEDPGFNSAIKRHSIFLSNLITTESDLFLNNIKQIVETYEMKKRELSNLIITGKPNIQSELRESPRRSNSP